MSLGIAIVGTALFGRLAGHDPAAFVGAAGHALLPAIAFLAAARAGGVLATAPRAEPLAVRAEVRRVAGGGPARRNASYFWPGR